MPSEFTKIAQEAAAQFVEEHKEVLAAMPRRYLPQLKKLVANCSVTPAGWATYGECQDLAFALEHGDFDLSPMKFRTWMDKVVGERITEMLEKDLPGN